MKSILAIMQHRTSARIIEDDDAPIRPFPKRLRISIGEILISLAEASMAITAKWILSPISACRVSMSLIFILLYLQKNHIYDFPTPIPIIILHLSQLFALFPFPIPFNQPITTRITSNRGTNTVSRISSRTLCSRTSSPIS